MHVLTDRTYADTPGKTDLVDVASLEARLRATIQGEVRFDDGSRALYATDASNYRHVPLGVVIPRDVDDMLRTVEAARQHGAPVLTRGGGTSLAGQCCNVAVVMDTTKYLHHVREIDPERKVARVQPGVILDDLRNAAEQHHLTFGPDPSTHNHCTLGGMIGNNSCGVHSVTAGKTVDNVEALDVLTYDGLRLQVGLTSDQELERIIAAGGRRGFLYEGLKSIRDRYAPLIRERYPDIPRRVSGYNLDQLLPEHGFNVARALVGSESTLVTVLDATVRLVPSPPGRALLVLGYPSVFEAADHVPEVLRHQPLGLEGMDGQLIRYMQRKRLHAQKVQLLPDGDGWLLAEFGGENRQEALDRAREVMQSIQQQDRPPTMRLLEDPRNAQHIWAVRKSGLGATAFVPGMDETWEGWEDSAVPPDKLGGYLRDLRALLASHGYVGALYGHFGDGCVHTRTNFDLATRAGIDQYRGFVFEAADLVLSYGGSLSGEHGDGQSRSELLPRMFGAELVQAFREFKALWDPDGKMNPGRIVDPYRIDQNLRLGASYNPPDPNTHFAYLEDEGSFARTSLRCVGVGECRKTEGGTMCPSYMVTREEQHSTRGRARLLFEMLQGDPIRGWRSEPVKEALDLCLACKACKGECPVNVDMATYKAEFLAHYYKGRFRPRGAYAFGLIMYWASLATRAPRLANFFTHAPLLRDVAKRAAGVAPERTIPSFAPQSFRDWFARRAPRGHGQPPVILWPDTFNNAFRPETAQAAVEVLEASHHQVLVPPEWLCCGRPLYDYGMLGRARRLLQRTLDTLRPQIRAGVPVVSLEPSCVSVFRDELVNLFPHDEDAKRLSHQTFTLAEFLAQLPDGFHPLPLERKALVQGHCHQGAIMGMDADDRVLRSLGLDYEVLDSGCCGMAGAFGYEKGDRYEVSVRSGERVLLPAVRAADEDTLIIADGFSCREQIEQRTGRKPLHLAEVLREALRQDAPRRRAPSE